jgi:hypothetical protein
MKFLNKIVSWFKEVLNRPEVKKIVNEIQEKAWADLKAIAFTAIAEAKAGNFSSGIEKRNAAFNRIKMYAYNKGKSYPDSLINWVIENAYQKFALEA